MAPSLEDQDGRKDKDDGASKGGKQAGSGRITFLSKAKAKARSATSTITLHNPPPASPTPSLNDESSRVTRPKGNTALIRSRSEDIRPLVKDEWASGIWGNPSLQASAHDLKASIDEYEQAATVENWGELMRIHGDIKDLGKLMPTRKDLKPDHQELDGMSKFTAVALEYSKMLDVVMNQSPEYAGIAWGAIRMLLVAHTNHSKLKHSVEHYLITFGQEFGVVNQLMNSHPTSKMLEAITEAYSAFSQFLAKAVGFYRESRLTSFVKAFSFPWETRFQAVVHRIEVAFKRIKEIANAGHFGVAVQSQQLLRSIGTGQEQMRLEMKQDSHDLRNHLKLEMKAEVQALFDAFDQNWIQRFEQIMIQSQAQQVQAILPSSSQDGLRRSLTFPARAEIGPPGENAEERPSLGVLTTHAESFSPGMPERASTSRQIGDTEIVGSPSAGEMLGITARATYLADYCSKLKKLQIFRDACFPLLQTTDRDRHHILARQRHLSTHDLQEIMGLLRNETVRSWLQNSCSSLLCLNTYRRSGTADWATAFAMRITEFAGKIPNMAVLYHFCGNHPISNPVSTVEVLMQSLIMQVIQQYPQTFEHRKSLAFTQEKFEASNQHLDELWGIFADVVLESGQPCFWVIIDALDNMQQSPAYYTLLRNLRQLAFQDNVVFKLYISTRGSDVPSALNEEISDPDSVTIRRCFTVNVPRTQTRATASLPRQKKLARIPDASPDLAPAREADIENLLDSSEDDLLLSDDDAEVMKSPEPISDKKTTTKPSSLRDDSDLSDSSIDFDKEPDPFASSSESEWERDGNDSKQKPPKNLDKDSDEDSSDDDFLFLTKGHPEEGGVHDSEMTGMSSDDDIH